MTRTEMAMQLQAPTSELRPASCGRQTGGRLQEESATYTADTTQQTRANNIRRCSRCAAAHPIQSAAAIRPLSLHTALSHMASDWDGT